MVVFGIGVVGRNMVIVDEFIVMVVMIVVDELIVMMAVVDGSLESLVQRVEISIINRIPFKLIACNS